MRLPDFLNIPVFLYGTLMDRAKRREVLKHDINGTPDLLPNTKKLSFKTPEGKGFHTVKRSDGSFVEGLLIKVDERDLKKIDDWEDEYHRETRTLASGKKAWVYVLKKEFEREK